MYLEVYEYFTMSPSLKLGYKVSYDINQIKQVFKDLGLDPKFRFKSFTLNDKENKVFEEHADYIKTSYDYKVFFLEGFIMKKYISSKSTTNSYVLLSN